MEPRIISFKPKTQFGYFEDAPDKDGGPPINNMDSIASVLALASPSTQQQQQHPTSTPPRSITSSSSLSSSNSSSGSSSTSVGDAAPQHRHIGLPPTFSRLPPDGHEFPPNFCEPLIVTPVPKQGRGQTVSNDTRTSHSATGKDDAPPLPKSGPPTPIAGVATGTRKVYRQDLVISVEDTRTHSTTPGADNSAMVVQSTKKTWSPAVLEDKSVRKEIMITAKNGHFAHPSTPIGTDATDFAPSPHTNDGGGHNAMAASRRRSIEQHDAFKKFDTPRKQIGALPTNWRKDEKSEKSVRDKIAMFSVEAAALAASDAANAAAAAATPINGTMPRKAHSTYALNRSTENLLSDSRCSNRTDSSFGKKSQSVERLDDIIMMSASLQSSPASRYGSSYDYAAYMADGVQSSAFVAEPAVPSRADAYMSKAYSVENLNHHTAYGGQYRGEPFTPPAPQRRPSEVISSGVTSSNSTTTTTTTIPASYASLPRTKPPTVTRTTSFSGAQSANHEDRRRSSINSLLEQRKKSMSKLRGLIIPEKMAIGHDVSGHVLHDLPEIKSKQSDQQQPAMLGGNAKASLNGGVAHAKREPIVPNPKHYTPAYQSIAGGAAEPTSMYKSIFGNGMLRSASSTPTSEGTPAVSRPTFKKQTSSPTPLSAAAGQYTMPPIKPPRTSLIIASRSSSDSQKSYTALDDSDSDSVFSSKVSSPPGSPVVHAAPGKFALTRTLSSETNTSIASSTTSTLTSGSGSQASCSSIGSTPTIDMSRKISKSSSNESYVNRKNILALAKCRSGKDDSSNQLGHRPHQQRRSGGGAGEDEDSTDGYDEDEVTRLRHAPKPKQRGASAAGGNGAAAASAAAHHHHQHHRMVIQAPVNSVPVSQPINYRLVSSADNIVDMVINVASYVEVVTSETDGESKHSSDACSPAKVNTKFIDAERLASFKATPPSPMTRSPKSEAKFCTPSIVAPIANTSLGKSDSSTAAVSVATPSNDMAKWVRTEASRNGLKATSAATTTPLAKVREPRQPAKPLSVSASIQKFNQTSSAEPPKTPNAAATSPSMPIKINAPTTGDKSRRSHDGSNINNRLTMTTTAIKSEKSPNSGYHERFSSLDSLASSSSSGISSSQASSLLTDPSPMLSTSGDHQPASATTTEFGSYSSFGSNHSLITPADLQLIIEEADPPLQRADAFVVVLQRESPECSVGVTLAGGADYETKEITIYRVLSNSPACKDGRLRKGDRILSVNGLSMRGLTHRESVAVLKTPRLEVVMVVTRSESVRQLGGGSNSALAKAKRASLGSLTSLHEKRHEVGVVNGSCAVGTGAGAGVVGNTKADEATRRKIVYHKLSQSLDMDLDMMSNEGSSIYDENKSVDGADDSTGSSMGDDAVFGMQETRPVRAQFGAQSTKSSEEARGRIVEIYKDNCGLGLAIEGGLDSPSGHCPLTVKKVFMGGAAEKTGQVSVGDVIVAINDFSTEQVTRVQAWNYMKSLPGGAVKFCLA